MRGGSILSYAEVTHQLKIEFGRARRHKFPLSCVMLQVDRLEHLRDLYGNASRDRILLEVQKVVRGQLRGSDCLGATTDRLILVLPHSDAGGVLQIAERLRRKIAALPFEVSDRAFSFSVSIGIASSTDGEDVIFADALLKKAEEALGRARDLGGNGTEVASFQGVE
jgi:diguanylate cyclase (GGDEF)-like protein